MALVIFAALPLVTRHREHVTVSLIDRLVGLGRARAIQRMACDLVSLCAVALIGWRLWIQAGEAVVANTRTIVLNWPMAPVTYIMSVCAAVTAVIIALQCWQDFRGEGPTP